MRAAARAPGYDLQRRIQGPHRRIWARLRGCGRTRAEGHPRPLALGQRSGMSPEGLRLPDGPRRSAGGRRPGSHPRAPARRRRSGTAGGCRLAIERPKPDRDFFALRPFRAEQTRAADGAEGLHPAVVGSEDADQLLTRKQAEPRTRNASLSSAEGARVLSAPRAVTVIGPEEGRRHLEANATAEARAVQRVLRARPSGHVRCTRPGHDESLDRLRDHRVPPRGVGPGRGRVFGNAPRVTAGLRPGSCAQQRRVMRPVRRSHGIAGRFSAGFQSSGLRTRRFIRTR